MMKIFICEDDEIQLELITKIIKKYILFKNYDLKLEITTQNPEELINYVKSNGGVGLYFLDVNLNNNINGIELASQIRKYDLSGKIVFITTHLELACLTFTYKVEALDYIPKNDMIDLKNKIIECIDIAYERYLYENSETNKSIIIKKGDSQLKIFTDTVNFIESSSVPHKLIIHLENRHIEFYGKIKDMVNFSQDFYRCHQSYVVNIKNILEVNSHTREIIMNNGERCYSSIRYIKGLLNKIHNKK